MDEKQVCKMFEDPKGFLKFLQTLPPHKTITNPALNNADMEDSLTGPDHAVWTALSWYLRDGVGLDRYNDPTTTCGTSVYHHLSEKPEKMTGINFPMQRLDHGGSWVYALYHNLPTNCQRSVSASLLAYYVREFLEEGGV